MTLYRVFTGAMANGPVVWLVEADCPEDALSWVERKERATAESDLARLEARGDQVMKSTLNAARKRIALWDSWWSLDDVEEIILPWNGEME